MANDKDVLIQSFPQGLQAALGIKGQGIPSLLEDRISPSIEFLDFYLVGRQESIAAAPVALAVGPVLSALVVPPGEFWYVWRIGAVVNPGAGAACTIAPAVIFGQGSLYPVGDYLAVAATQEGRIGSQVPFLVPPGSTVGVNCQALTLAVNVTCYALITRLRV